MCCEAGNLMIQYKSNIDENVENLPWALFLFLFIIFYFATWYDLFYTVKGPNTVEEMTLLVEKGLLGRRIGLFCLGGVGLFNLLLKIRMSNKINDILGIAIIIYLIWVFISILWSDEQVLTIRKVIVLAMLWIGAAWIAARYSIRAIGYFVLFSGLITIILGVLAEIYLGTFQPLNISYRFAGTFHPNTQGLNCAILAITSYSLSKTETRWRNLYYIMTIVALVFLFLTKSRAAFLSAVIPISIYWIIVSSKWRRLSLVAFTLILVPLLGLFYGDNILNFGNKATHIGRDVSDIDTLSLRSPLWKECLSYISQRPIQGYGYDSFWTPRQIRKSSKNQGWDVPHSHSGYIEVALSLGIIGLLVFVGILFLGGGKALLLYLRTGDRLYIYCFSMIMWLCLNMFFEIVNMHPFIAIFVCIVLVIKLAYIDITGLDKNRKSMPQTNCN